MKRYLNYNNNRHFINKGLSMVEIKEQTLIGMIEDGFFDEWRNIKEVLKELSRTGFSIKGKKISRLVQSLTQLCRKHFLERNEVPKDKTNEEGGSWLYKKRKVRVDQDGNR